MVKDAIISPLLTKEHQLKYPNVIMGNNAQDVLKLASQARHGECLINRMFMYPFLGMSGHTLKVNHSHGAWAGIQEWTQVCIFYDGRHHAEPIETCRYMGKNYENCKHHNVHDIDIFLEEVIKNDIISFENYTMGLHQELTEQDCNEGEFLFTSNYWKRRSEIAFQAQDLVESWIPESFKKKKH